MVKIEKIGNDKIKIDGIEISIKDYNGYTIDGGGAGGRFGWYKDDEFAIREEYLKLAKEVFIHHSKENPDSPTGFYETEEYLKEKEKILKVNRNAYREAEKIEEKILNLSQKFYKIGSKAVYGNESFDDDENKIKEWVEKNNEIIAEYLKLYKEILPKLRQVFTQKEKTGNDDYGKDYNDPNKDKSREKLGQRANEIEAYRKKVRGEIESVLNQDPQITNEELEFDNRSWVDQIWHSHIALGEKEIDRIKDQVLTDISIKRTAKKGAKEKKNEWEKVVDEAKVKALQEIATVLRGEWISESDLSSDCKNWREQIEKAAGEANANKIEDTKNKLLADIKKQKNQKVQTEKTQAENDAQNLGKKTKDDVEKMKDEELEKSMKLFIRWEGEEKVKGIETVSQIEEKLMKNAPELYRETIIEALQKRISDYGISMNELDEETRKIIRGEITDVNIIKGKKDLAIRKIGTEGAKKKWTSLISDAKALLSKTKESITEQVKKDLKTIQEQLKNFKSGTNSYLNSYYQSNKAEVSKLESELQKISGQEQGQPSKKGFFQPKVIIPIASVLVLTAVIVPLVIKSRKRKQAKVEE